MKRKIIVLSVILAINLMAFGNECYAQASETSPEKVAQALVDAFNAHDVEAILKTYSPDSIAYSLPDNAVLLTGHAEIRRKFTTAFEHVPKVKVEIVNRIVDGKFVIDKEKITGELNGKSLERYGYL